MLDRELHAVYDRINKACDRVGRKSDEIKLILVTKEVELARIQEAYNLGCRFFGENKVQELTKKKDLLQS